MKFSCQTISRLLSSQYSHQTVSDRRQELFSL